ncbi:hypothetical protein [Hyphobacterium sp.]|uniref:hypothetical protein n=1 Tax=Hyphobacterium sp. TaxID=2004662 RepID=UPI003747EE3D
MTSKPKPSVTSNPRVRQILLGWGITVILAVLFAGYFAVLDWLPHDWIGSIGFVLALFSIANGIGWAYRRFRGEADTIGGESRISSQPPRRAQTAYPARLMNSMTVPVLGYSLPLAFIIGGITLFTDGSLSGFIITILAVFLVTLPFAAFAGLTIFEAGRPGQFGPESFKMPTKDDQNP